jgi:hypothetical protein
VGNDDSWYCFCSSRRLMHIDAWLKKKSYLLFKQKLSQFGRQIDEHENVLSYQNDSLPMQISASHKASQHSPNNRSRPGPTLSTSQSRTHIFISTFNISEGLNEHVCLYFDTWNKRTERSFATCLGTACVIPTTYLFAYIFLCHASQYLQVHLPHFVWGTSLMLLWVHV